MRESCGLRPRPVLALHVWALWVLAAAPVLNLLRHYPEFFIAHDAAAGQILGFVALLVAGLPLPWVLLACLLRAKAIAWILVLPPLAVVGLQIGMAAGLGAGSLLGAAALVLSAGWAYRRQESVRRYFSWLALVALVAPAGFLADPAIRRLWLPQPDPPNLGQAVTAGAPTIVVVLDELPVATLLDADGALDRRRFPNLAGLADQAHWFDNVVSVDSSTPKALSAILTGRRLAPGQLPQASDLPISLFRLLAPGYRVTALEPVTRICPPEINHLAEHDLGQPDLLADAAIVALHLIVPPPLSRRMPDIAALWGGFGEVASSAPTDGGEQGGFAGWEKIFHQAGRAARSNRLGQFETFLAAIDGRRRGALYFVHLLLPHRPWVYLPSGKIYIPRRYREPRVFQAKAWPDSAAYAAQAYQRHLLQAEYVDRLIGELLARLRLVGVFDDALIAITADHGISFVPGEMKRGVTAANRADVLQVPLLLKLPRQTQGAHHPERHSTLDLLPTLLEVLGLEVPNEVEGRSLFSPAADAVHPAPVQDALAYRAAIFGDLGQPSALFDYGPYGNWIGRRLRDLDFATEPDYRIDLLMPGWEFRYDGADRRIPAWVVGALESAGPPRRLGLAVAVDGTIAATTELDPADSTGRFRALLPESALGAGIHELQIIVIDPQTGRAVLAAPR
ncbi:MAG: sulfatase-like hydrolase/transferase [Acidobacteria bacterium]|nr:sulfatase-like hydrolase/transferase [Acidobacteriota bacterium]